MTDLPTIDLAYVKARLENQVLGNLSGELLKDVDRIFHINTAKDYIFSMISVNGPWYFSRVTETIWFNDADHNEKGSTFKLSHTPSNIFLCADPIATHHQTMKQQQIAFGYISQDQTQYKPVVEDTPHREDLEEFMVTGEREIQTQFQHASITISYARFSDWQEDPSAVIDMPVSLIGALHFTALKFAVTALMDQGIEISGVFDGMGDKILNMYGLNAGMLNTVKGFSA